MEWYSVLQISFHENNFKAYPLRSLGTFEDVLRTLAANAGIADWLEMLHVEDGMLIYQGLRILLNNQGVPLYAHVSSGLSWHKYAACDVYQSFHSPYMDVDDSRPAWWLVCDEQPYPWMRWIPRAEDWCYLHSWVAYGQVERQLTNDYTVDLRIPRGVQEVCQIFAVNTPADFRRMPAQVQGRIVQVMRQVVPGVNIAAMMDRRIYSMTDAATYGLTRAPREGHGKGNGKGILPIMDVRRRANL